MMMKVTQLLFATLWSTTQVLGFSVQPLLTRSGSKVTPPPLVVLYASRQRQKIASRTEWLARRGTTTTTTTTTTDSNNNSNNSNVGLFSNDQGLEFIRLVHPETGASSELYLYGGVVTSYKDGDGTEFIAVRPDAKLDGSKPISGGLSHCWPQFGPGAIQQHGFARNVPWSVKSQTATTAELELLPSDYTKAMWDKDFACTFSVSLQADQLDTKLVVQNVASSSSSEKSFDFQAALHSYFTVSALSNLQISGSFAGKEFLNKVSGATETEERSVITIAEEYDRVYKGVNDPVLQDAGTGKKLAVLNTAGWEDTVIWSPYGNEGMGYNQFVCVESVKFDPVTLSGGDSWVGDMTLKPSAI